MLAVLKVLSLSFFRICCLRGRPQDLPAAAELLAVALLAYGLSSFTLTRLVYPSGAALLATLVECALLPALTLAILALRGVPRRWLQTTTAIAGTGALFTVASLPVFAGIGAVGEAGTAYPALYLASLFLLVWNVAVVGHILAHALDVPYAVAVPTAIAFVWVIAAVVGTFLAAPPA